MDLSKTAADLARRLDRLDPPSHRNPERYFEERSDLALMARKLSAALGGGSPRRETIRSFRAF
jgi:hypothetical protein